MQQKRLKLNELGMSLIELSAALTIIAVVAVGGIMMSSQVLRLKFDSEAKVNVFNYQDLLAETLIREVSRLANASIYNATTWASNFQALSLPGNSGTIQIVPGNFPTELNSFFNKLNPSSPQQKEFRDALNRCKTKPTVPANAAASGVYSFCVSLSRSGEGQSVTSLLDAEAAIVEARADLFSKKSNHSAKVRGPSISAGNYIGQGLNGQQVSLNYRILWKRKGSLDPSGRFQDVGFYTLTGQKVVNIDELR